MEGMCLDNYESRSQFKNFMREDFSETIFVSFSFRVNILTPR